MNVSLRKVIRAQKLLFNIGLAVAFAIILIQFIYTSYYIYQGVNFTKSSSIQSYSSITNTQLSSLKVFDIGTFINTDSHYNLTDRFAFFSDSPACTSLGISALLKQIQTPVHRCDSYLNESGNWLNIIYYSKYQLNTPLSATFGIVIIVLLVLIFIAVIQIKWSMPFFEFQRFAQDMGMRMQASPIHIHKGLFTKQAAETFDFMQERITNVLKYQNKLLAMTCHDIRTPLARMQARRLKEYGKLDKLDQRDIKEINQMLDDLVLFSKDNWLSGIQFEPTNISDFFEECISAYLEDGRQIRFVNMLDEDIEIDIKKAAFKRAINNLINNALKHGKHVEVILTNNPNAPRHLQINIMDDGPGIPKAEIKNVFNPFYTGSSSIKGNGLGLSITKEVIDIHGGAITLYNRPEGGLDVCILL
ncbi:sensor histidine kinase [Fangia hongkongensis]|uniref:sensor histidine kinase n=1 Tax=Fangia hongkongensis TaxID=270495 RepID=UPI00037D92C9|nr:HAMP domain-containing sensor histidine kinase [Fangia hongkongensis]MBK2124978.1 HAMP domain-containing histidine kinase [Fangia hongkongensis]